MTALYCRIPSYDHLRVFGCACYLNTSSTRPHKLAPRSFVCIFLGYPANYRGYRCLDLSTGKIILSRHVTLDETNLPFSSQPNNIPTTPSFLDTDPTPLLFHPNLTSVATPSTPTSLFSNHIPTPPASTLPTHAPEQSHSPLLPLHSPAHSQTTPNSPTTMLPQTAFPQSPSPPSPPPPPPPPSHPIVTRLKAGIIKRRVPLNLHTTKDSPISPLPTSHLKALADPNWTEAMNDEYRALMNNKTWDLVPRPPDTNII